jgi:L-alanine-DL-glutamate epimerase-like enolase superfamily enzyme
LLHWVQRDLDELGRAALEAGLLDLALRQAGVGLGDLCGVAAAELRTVVSFAAVPTPATQIRALQAAGRGPEFKIDVDPGWSAAVVTELESHAAAIAVFDCKERGDADLCGRLERACPHALIEDPPAGARTVRTARDRSLRSPGDVDAAARRGDAINLKAPRMGGPLNVLRALERAAALAPVSYVGGMFEVGPGRVQARQLAALFCPQGPNDLAPLAGAIMPGSAPAATSIGVRTIRLDVPGFGGGGDWVGALLGRARPS